MVTASSAIKEGSGYYTHLAIEECMSYFSAEYQHHNPNYVTWNCQLATVDIIAYTATTTSQKPESTGV